MKCAASRLLSCYLFRFIIVDLFALFFFALYLKTAKQIPIMLKWRMAIKSDMTSWSNDAVKVANEISCDADVHVPFIRSIFSLILSPHICKAKKLGN